ncbi:unnamed protein product [Protopolystoma xenopodis]|uniref:Uncharacterized protein n=1 Tax=Protopolystoma xenopodis TaxID=117903 RepID=A0A3S5AJX2_9PLAT|nr:unnamed protein product [Protopolystoma xenopodis]
MWMDDTHPISVNSDFSPPQHEMLSGQKTANELVDHLFEFAQHLSWSPHFPPVLFSLPGQTQAPNTFGPTQATVTASSSESCQPASVAIGPYDEPDRRCVGHQDNFTISPEESRKPEDGLGLRRSGLRPDLELPELGTGGSTLRKSEMDSFEAGIARLMHTQTDESRDLVPFAMAEFHQPHQMEACNTGIHIFHPP